MGYSQYDLVWMGKSRSLQLSLVCLIDGEGTIYAEKQKKKKKKKHRNNNELERILVATLFRVQVLSFLKNISLFKCFFLCVCSSCPTLCDPMDCSSPGSSVHGILQAIIFQQVAIPYSWNSLVAQMVKNLPPMRETWV